MYFMSNFFFFIVVFMYIFFSYKTGKYYFMAPIMCVFFISKAMSISFFFNFAENWELLYCFHFFFYPYENFVIFRCDYFSSMMQLTLYMVSFGIVLFCSWYIEDSVNFMYFVMVILGFVCTMDFLAISTNMICMYVAWELLGVVSLVLINHWKCRRDSFISSFMAFFYNRIGDFGFFFCVIMYMIFIDVGVFFFDVVSFKVFMNVFFFMIFFSCCVKSSQVFFYPWLKFAMEGPTPVSALLHSSTMVVAGVFVMSSVSFSFVVGYSNFIKGLIVGFGVITCAYGGVMSFYQFDMKKLAAYSTMSHLGLMFFATALGNVIFVFFHMVIHACCKAALFMCIGCIQHMAGSQDLRQIKGIGWVMPYLSAMCGVCMLGLSGVPMVFIWWSKHLIMDAISHFLFFSAFFYMLFFFSCFFSVFYCFKAFFFIFYPTVGGVNKFVATGQFFYTSVVSWGFLLIFFCCYFTSVAYFNHFFFIGGANWELSTFSWVWGAAMLIWFFFMFEIFFFGVHGASSWVFSFFYKALVWVGNIEIFWFYFFKYFFWVFKFSEVFGSQKFVYFSVSFFMVMVFFTVGMVFLY